jgi:hypothetical protein
MIELWVMQWRKLLTRLENKSNRVQLFLNFIASLFQLLRFFL